MAGPADLILAVDVPPGNICKVSVSQRITPPAKPDSVVRSFFEENSTLTPVGTDLGTGVATDRRDTNLVSQSIEFDHVTTSGSAVFSIDATDVTAGAPLTVLDPNWAPLTSYTVTGLEFKVVVEFQ